MTLSRRTFLTGSALVGTATALGTGTADAAGRPVGGAPAKGPQSGRNLGEGPSFPLPDGYDYPLGLPLPFAHGVASGDPMSDRVILWTRITLPTYDGVSGIDVVWEVFTDPSGSGVPVSSGSVTTTGDRDWTVKVDAGGLQPLSTYYYRFTALGWTSPVGRTRTAPLGNLNLTAPPPPAAPGSTFGTTIVPDVQPDELRFGVVSCASYWSVVKWDGMRRLAERNDLDLIVHCGDHLYDYPDEDEWVRAPHQGDDPTKWTETDVDFRRWESLAELRRRYALYYADPDFLYLHQQHPFFIMWDNHDLSNGSKNLITDDEVVQAFWEWVPARPPKGDGSGIYPYPTTGLVTPEDPNYVYRSLDYGPMVDLRCIDVRHIATDAERAGGSFLGATQLQWLLGSFDTSAKAGQTWRFMANGNPFGQFHTTDSAGTPLPLPASPAGGDYGAWDTHPAERATIVGHLRTNKINDLVILTGDTHGSMLWDVTDDDTPTVYNPVTGSGSVGVEFLPTSLGRGGATETIAGTAYRADHNMSPPYGDRTGFQPYLDAAPPGSTALSEAVLARNASFRYLEWDSHGYGIVHLTKAQATLELWWQAIRTSATTDTLGAQFTVPLGSNHVTQVQTPAATKGTRVSQQAPPATVSPVVHRQPHAVARADAGNPGLHFRG